MMKSERFLVTLVLVVLIENVKHVQGQPGWGTTKAPETTTKPYWDTTRYYPFTTAAPTTPPPAQTTTVYFYPTTERIWRTTERPSNSNYSLKQQVVLCSEQLVALVSRILITYHGHDKWLLEEELRNILGVLERIEQDGGQYASEDLFAQLANRQSVVLELLTRII